MKEGLKTNQILKKKNINNLFLKTTKTRIKAFQKNLKKQKILKKENH